MTVLRDLIGKRGSDEARLLQARMTVIGVDVGAWTRFEPDILRDLQSVCAACGSRATCADDLRRHVDDPTWPDWRDYCPDAAKLDMLVALQFY
jgi:hypothetical protein